MWSFTQSSTVLNCMFHSFTLLKSHLSCIYMCVCVCVCIMSYISYIYMSCITAIQCYLVLHVSKLQQSCLENPMDGGAWWATVHRVTTSQTRLSDFTFTFHFHTLEEEMATRSSVLAMRIPGTGSLVGCRLWGRTESGTAEAT